MKTHYTEVAFFVQPPRRDTPGHAYGVLRVPTEVLVLAFNGWIGTMPPHWDNLLLTDKSMLQLPVSLPVAALFKQVCTTPHAAKLAALLLPYHLPEQACRPDRAAVIQPEHAAPR